MNSLIHEIELIAERVFDRKFAEKRDLSAGNSLSSVEASKLRNTLALVNAKDFISIKETALLLNCSDAHVRNLIQKARKGETKSPIPFTDLDGITVFPRLALLEWVHMPKRKLKGFER